MKTYQLTVNTLLGERTLTYTDYKEYYENREHAIMLNMLIEDEISEDEGRWVNGYYQSPNEVCYEYTNDE